MSLLRRLDVPDGNSDAVYWRQRLASWDCVYSIDSVEASVMATWTVLLQRLPQVQTRQAYWDDWGWMLNAFELKPAGGFSASTTTLNRQGVRSAQDSELCGGDCDAWAAQRFIEAVQLTQASSQTSALEWGRSCHKAQLGHQALTDSIVDCLANRYIASGGDDTSINVGPWDVEQSDSATQAPDLRFKQTFGASYRHVIDMADPEASMFLIPMGQDGNLFGRGYDRFNYMWTHSQYVPMRTRDYEIDEQWKMSP